ncbi:response regulator transcription factor [Plantactinospora sp. KLBMP9567]|uniref:response regulator transcription factor n=1 Tax=Plantactinospora sp. KLBMP9567 TaxID=3085900 RepID=UPI0029825E9A|nr:response regulator transcription factor [Plantactinospora sp. KLBMP9567]MDW5324214.1 response regulator transcription factor [Plantactinospora sp. KLBMP9567]
MIRIVLVDDQELVRAGLRLILSTHDDLVIVGEAADGRAGVDLAGRLGPDVVLMDIRMPVLDGIEATRRLAGVEGAPPVLALTTFGDDEVLWGVIEAGAAGFVLKDAPAAELVGAIRVTARGGSWFDPQVAARVLALVRGRRAGRPASSVAALTGRELEVLRLVASGANNVEIAGTLHLSERTVKGHVSAIFLKLGVRDRAGAIVRAYDAGIVPGR